MSLNLADLISNPAPGFSFEVLPPLKGRGIRSLLNNVELLMPYGPRFVNITTHRSELVYKSVADGLYQRVSERARPGTVAVAAAIQNRYNLPAVPHMICSGFTALETEYALIDLSFLGINNLLVLRGDKAKHEPRFKAQEGGHTHASDLQKQINTFNDGLLLDGTGFEHETNFHYGVAGYPEKHEESPNFESDLQRLKEKVDLGAEYIVTQLFFDNAKFFRFVEACRAAGINVPIVPGVKTLVSKGQLNVIPKTFKVDLPHELVESVEGCTTDADVKKAGVDFAIRQVRELIDNGFTHIHFYSHNATPSVHSVVKAIFPEK